MNWASKEITLTLMPNEFRLPTRRGFLGLIGAGGLGLLISEAVSLFQWPRLATLLLVVIALVTAFDAVSRRLREQLL